MRAARRIAQGRAKPVDWLVQDLYGMGEDEDAAAAARRNDEAAQSDEERESLRRQVGRARWARARIVCGALPVPPWACVGGRAWDGGRS